MDKPIRLVDGSALYPVLTKREYFAGLAMQALISADKHSAGHLEVQSLYAEMATIYADELINQLEK